MQWLFSSLVLAFSLILIGCSSAPDTRSEENARTRNVDIFHDRNVETAALLLALQGEQSFASQPLREHALDQFAAQKEHRAVDLTRELYPVFGTGGIIELSLKANPFPAGGLRAEIPDVYLERASGNDDLEEGRRRILSLIEAMNAFYRETPIDSFLERHAAYYEGAIRELEMLKPKWSLIAGMEAYFGSRNSSYSIIPSLLYSAYSNVGVSATNNGQTHLYYVVAPYRPVPDSMFWNDKLFGYLDYEHEEIYRNALTNVATHEYGHSFVNPHTLNAMAEINTFDHLQIPIAEQMAAQGYPEWWSIANEHLVRLCEVRIALSLGDSLRANSLREEYVTKRGFIYLPHLEDTITRYEQNRERYPSFGDFVPELIADFNRIDTIEINSTFGE